LNPLRFVVVVVFFSSLYSKNLLQNTKAENLQFACISPSQEEEEGEEKIMYEFLLFS